MYRAGIFHHHVPAQRAQATAAATGIATVEYDYVPQGYCWYIERYSVHCPTSGAVASVFVTNGASGTAALSSGFRVDYTTAGADAVGDSNTPIYVPEGYHLVIQWTSATSGDACVAAIQYAVHELDPLVQPIMSRQDMAQVEESHETPASPLTVGAVGEKAV